VDKWEYPNMAGEWGITQDNGMQWVKGEGNTGMVRIRHTDSPSASTLDGIFCFQIFTVRLE